MIVKCWRLWVKVDEIDVKVDEKVEEIVGWYLYVVDFYKQL